MKNGVEQVGKGYGEEGTTPHVLGMQFTPHNDMPLSQTMSTGHWGKTKDERETYRKLIRSGDLVLMLVLPMAKFTQSMMAKES